VKPVFSFRNCTILAGPILSSLSVYFILSSLLLFPSDIAIALSVILFSLLLGLSCYLLLVRDESSRKENALSLIKGNNNDSYDNSSHHTKDGADKKNSASNLIFITIYVITIIIVGTSKPLGVSGELFIAWSQLFASPTQILQLGGAFLLTFFFPGYVFVYFLTKVHPLEHLPKILLSFIFSMLIAGLSVYVVAIIIGVPAESLNLIIIGIDVSVLIPYIIYSKMKRTLSLNLDTIGSFFSQSLSKFPMVVTKENLVLFIIFASLFGMAIFYTCYLEKGVIVGDQWFHHGRALLINSGTFRDFTASDEGRYDPPFFPALIAGFFSLSGVPSVNAYVSLNILNMMAIFAFYYFFSRWVPSNQRKAVILATVLFVLSSGFGWILVLDNSLTNSYHPTQESSLENLHWASIKSSDIRTPNTFFNVGHPTFTSPLIILGLPAGFVLLGVLKEHNAKQSKLRFICIVTMIVAFGVLSHPEFYLFIIIGSILLLAFQLSSRNLIYASFILALSFCVLVNLLSPQNYYTVVKILNAPLLILSLVFVSILWGLYRTRILSNLFRSKFINDSFLFTKFKNFTSKNTTKIAVISILAYLYLFTFVVLEALSVDDIQIQVGTSTQRNIPWYLYPVKLGVVGLLGLAFILSYLFKRFEKEIFVFGIIAVVALIAGPYYDEHRLGKYIMVGMVGFASLLIYKVIFFLQRPNYDLRYQSHSSTCQLKPLFSSLLIGLVISSAALSVFMLAGYKTLGYKSPLFQEDFFRINFPSQSEMNLLKFFRTDLPNLNTHFIAIQANDTQTENLFSKLVGFSATPRARILQNPQSLNASSLEGLYSSLQNDNIMYVILLKTNADRIEQIPMPFHFALDNFPRVYQDDTYIVLKVPDMAPPLSLRAVDIGLVYDKKYELPPLSIIPNDTNYSNGNILQYNYKFFNNIQNGSKFVKIEKIENGIGIESKGNEKEILTLRGDEKARTLWSSPINVQNKVNYVEAKYRLVAENKTRNDFGIRMEDKTNNQQYYVTIDKNSLDLKQKSLLENMSNKERILSQYRELPIEQRGLWHTLKILVLKDTINVYLDDMLKIKAPKSSFVENFSSISKIGITGNKNIVQFEPLKIGYLSESALESYQKNNMRDTYNRHYYPLSALALSKIGYDTFIDGDSSAFSKNNVILTSDPRLELGANEKWIANVSGTQDRGVISEEEFNRYLEYVKLGGTLIVMNQDSNISNHDNSNKSEQGAFSKLLSFRYGDKTLFNGIASDRERNPVNKIQRNTFLNISGLATNVIFSNSSDIKVKSYYVDVEKDNNGKYKSVAPFAIEKKYGKGKLVLVNIAGYFDALYKSDNQEFTSINDIPKLIGLESKSNMNYVVPPKDTTIFADAKIIGNVKISNYTGVTIKSSDLLLEDIIGRASAYNLTINKISVSPHMQIQTNTSNDNGGLQVQNLEKNTTNNQKDIFNTVTIKGLKLFGHYGVIINSTGNQFRLSPTSSYFDYIGLAIPVQFDMLLNFSKGGYGEFTIISCTNTDCQQQQVRIPEGDEVYFHNIKFDTPSIPSLPVYLKSPKIMINNGTVKFKLDSNFNNPSQPTGNIVANGNIAVNFGHVETYNSFNKNGTKTDFVIYLKSLDIQGNYVREDRQSDTLRLPGDISQRAKDKGIGVPWESKMMSFTSIIIMISIIAVVIALKYYLLPKIQQNKELYEK
jgi:hypothetical protein